jgi:hypothetical protein
MIRIVNLVLTIFFLLVACSNKPITAAEVLERYFKTVSGGDATKWDGLKLAYVESSITDPGSQKPAVIYKEYLSFPDLQRLDEVKNGVSTILSIYRDRTFFAPAPTDMPPGLPPIPPIVIPQSSPPFVFETMQVRQIMESSKATELVGLTELDGRPVYEITFELPAVVWRYYFDAENFTALKAVQEGQARENKKVFSDYRVIDGLSIPMRIESWTNFGPVTRHQIDVRTNVDFHPKIDVNFFDVPKDWKF